MRQGVLEEGGRERGQPPPKKNFPQIFVFAKNFPEGRQGMLEGGGCHPHPQKFHHDKAKKFPEVVSSAAGRQGVLKGGRKGGGSSPPSKKTGRKAPQNNLVKT